MCVCVEGACVRITLLFFPHYLLPLLVAVLVLRCARVCVYVFYVYIGGSSGVCFVRARVRMWVFCACMC